jgi:hypothetical protein
VGSRARTLSIQSERRRAARKTCCVVAWPATGPQAPSRSAPTGGVPASSRIRNLRCWSPASWQNSSRGSDRDWGGKGKLRPQVGRFVPTNETAVAVACGNEQQRCSKCQRSLRNVKCPGLRDLGAANPHRNRRSIRRLFALSLHLCRFNPPHQIVSKARKRPFESLTASTRGRTIRSEGLSNGTNGNRT